MKRTLILGKESHDVELLHQDGVTAPIVGATKLEHLENAVGALEVHLAPEEVAALEAPYVPHPIAGF